MTGRIDVKLAVQSDMRAIQSAVRIVDGAIRQLRSFAALGAGALLGGGGVAGAIRLTKAVADMGGRLTDLQARTGVRVWERRNFSTAATE